MLTNRSYPARVPNQKLQDLKRTSEGLEIAVADLKRYRDNILTCINQGFVKDVSTSYFLTLLKEFFLFTDDYTIQ